MKDRINALKEKLKDSSSDLTLKKVMRDNGLFPYMSGRWLLDFHGKATIFAERRPNEKVLFSANFEIKTEKNKRGSITCAEIDISLAEDGLEEIITLLEKKYE